MSFTLAGVTLVPWMSRPPAFRVGALGRRIAVQMVRDDPQRLLHRPYGLQRLRRLARPKKLMDQNRPL
jgi:hypothetical protein